MAPEVEQLRLARAHLEQMIAQARADAPLETCGLLAGCEGRVMRVLPVPNALGSPTAYRMDGQELVDAMIACNFEPLAIYHSHPHGPPTPSPKDIAEAFYPDSIYVIISLEQTPPSVRAFRIARGQVTEIKLMVEETFDLTQDQIRRYARHIVMPQLGSQGQRKLLDSRVLIIGVGGLGSPVSLYLAAAGVGTLGLVDNDVVDVSNLQRQIVHRNANTGRPKVASAAETLRALNPDVNVVQHQVAFSETNAMELVTEYDLVVVCTDDFPSKYLANDACVLSNRPLVWGAIFQLEGQMSVVLPRHGPCYRCIFPSPPPPGSVPSSAESGMLGAVAGIIGSWQALEAIKLLASIGEPMIGRLLILDGLAGEINTIKVERRNDCNLCGDHPTIKQL